MRATYSLPLTSPRQDTFVEGPWQFYLGADYSDPLFDCTSDKRYSRDERGCAVDESRSIANIERWTARRKADLVLEIIKGQKTIVDAEGGMHLVEYLDLVAGGEVDHTIVDPGIQH